ncbi:hypothetical protein LINGRAHAP2_LOCUS32898, partial [Linum grandiflorum]
KCEDENWSADVAEGSALLFGLEEFIARRICPLIVESDCKKLVELLKKNIVCRTEIGSICRDIKNLAMVCDIRDWSFTYRETNSAAHILAHLNISGCNEMVWTDSFPREIIDVVAAEANNY